MTEADWATDTAAQLWCLPEHSGKEMDVAFGQSIAAALRKARADGYEKGFVECGHVLAEAANGLFLDLLKDPELLAKVRVRGAQIAQGPT